MSKKKIFLLYPYYWPHFKAGGPVQSLFNLVKAFGGIVDYYTISLAKDIDGSVPEEALQLGKWCKGINQENIYYASSLSPAFIYARMKEVNPDVVFINGIFHWTTSLVGLIAAKILRKKVILSPRGMLQAWALHQRKWKKKVYLLLFKSILKKNEIWHATDSQEQHDIYSIFGKSQVVHVASNIPRMIGEGSIIPFPDESKKIQLIFLSLINPNKNLHLIIEAVKKFKNFQLDIYGPVMNYEYWKGCKLQMQGLEHISYKGSVLPWNVPSLVSHYHFFVLPTQGENFGHAIFDSLASGVPVIISKNTPWLEIDGNQAGFYINIENASSLVNTLENILTLDQSAYNTYRTNSLDYAKRYWQTNNFIQQYHFLLHN